MFSGIVRRFAGTAAAGSLIAVAGLSAAGTPMTASAQQAGGCVINGTAAITPGLNVLPAAQGVIFSGVASPCAIVPTLNAGGQFNGTISCPNGNLATCVPFASLTVSASPFGGCGGGGANQPVGVLVQEGVVVESLCQQGSGTGTTGAVVSVDVFTSNNGTSLPVTSVTFVGVAAGAQT